MSGILCSMVGASFVTVAAEVIRRKKGIVALGNAQVDTAQSQFGGASALFDGTGDYLSIAHDSSLSLADYSDWTIECWSRLTDGTSRTILNKDGVAGSLYPGYTFFTNGSKQVIFGVGGSAGNWITVTRSTALADNTWYHLAAVKSGSTVTFYVDGTSAGTATFVGYADQSRALFIGYEQDGTFMYGHIDEVRISKTARYTTTFTPSATAFVNDADTVFLMHANGTDASTFFEDDNGVRAQAGISARGNAQVDTAQSKFGGASLLLDGTGDALSTAGIAFGTAAFTVEYWIRPTAQSGYDIHWDLRGDPSSNLSPIVYTLNGTLYMDVGATTVITGSALSNNTWYHIALARSGSSTKLFVDGTQVGSTYTDSNNYVSAATLYIGELYSLGGNGVVGNMDEFRISNSARYTTTFTPSTTPFVNDSNTLLLIHADGTDATTVFVDDNGARAPKGISALGNAQVDTAQSKFGGASALFDGTGDYLDVALTNTFTGDFTIEYFMRMSTTVDFQAMFILGSAGTDGTEIFYRNSDQKLVFDVWNKFSITSSSTVTTNTWYHIAASRIGSALTMYINGTSVASTTYTGSIGNGGTLNIGRRSDNIWYWNGHIDEFRISDTARYTANFTAPTAPFQSDANTVLLIHADGTDASTVFIDDNGVTPTHSYT